MVKQNDKIRLSQYNILSFMTPFVLLQFNKEERAMKKTASGLVAYVKAQVGRPYWLGGFGQTASRSLYDQNKVRLGYGSWDVYDQDVGKKVHDCCGMIKGYCWTDGPDVPYKPGQYKTNECGDWGVDTMYKKCKEAGTVGSINTIPEIPGLLVFNASLGHVGIYIGNGEIIEAHSTNRDVIKSTIKTRNFVYWGKAPWLIYDTEKKPAPATNSNDYKEIVKQFQDWLNDNYGRYFKTDDIIGGLLVLDGGCGMRTKRAAVYAMQVELNKLGEKLELDGGCGKLTQAAMSRHMVKKITRDKRAYIIQGLLYGAGFDCNGWDGSFNNGAEKATKDFQTKMKIEVDGKVGGETFDKLTD